MPRRKKAEPLVKWDFVKPALVDTCGNQFWLSSDERFKIVEFARYNDIPMTHRKWIVWKLTAFKGVEKASFVNVGEFGSRKRAVICCEAKRKADQHFEIEED